MRPADGALLGIDWTVEGAGTFTLVPHLCRPDGRFYGGSAIAVALAASEEVTGRPALWSTTQLVGTGAVGATATLATAVVASGRTVSQVQVTATIDGELLFTALGACADPIDGGLAGEGVSMPDVPPPEDCPVMWGPDHAPTFAFQEAPMSIGQHLVSEHRLAALGPTDARRGRRALWSRVVPPERSGGPMTPAGIGFVADMVPIAVTDACGVMGAGTSLDQTLRLGRPCASEWVLLDVQAEVATGGLGHGRALVWSPDGVCLGVASQTARLFSFEDAARRRGSPPAG